MSFPNTPEALFEIKAQIVSSHLKQALLVNILGQAYNTDSELLSFKQKFKQNNLLGKASNALENKDLKRYVDAF